MQVSKSARGGGGGGRGGVRRLRQFLPLGHNAVQHTDHYPQLRQTAQPGHAGIHSHLSCLLLVAWPAGGGHQQVKRIRVTAVGHALADSGCQLLELHDRTLSRQRGHRRQFDAWAGVGVSSSCGCADRAASETAAPECHGPVTSHHGATGDNARRLRKQTRHPVGSARRAPLGI